MDAGAAMAATAMAAALGEVDVFPPTTDFLFKRRMSLNSTTASLISGNGISDH
jgi:hypothetical protein